MMESRSFYEVSQELDKIRALSQGPALGTVEAGYYGSRKDRRAQAAVDRREIKKRKRQSATASAIPA